jgi:succinate dehydrogenase / fumarate reductase, cytochrome b subunit
LRISLGAPQKIGENTALVFTYPLLKGEVDMPEAAKPRPQFRNIHVTDIVKYRLPLAGIVSILHRISGLLIFLLLPFLLCLWDQSLASENAFNGLQAFAQNGIVKIILLALTWAYLHHFFAGLRYLALDVHWGIDKEPARRSAAGVLLISLPLTALVALKLFGVF